jgi:cell division septum initiation protein DivIVA
MGVLELLDDIENLIDQGKKIPFTHNVNINMDRMLELLDHIRESFPEELSQAKWILQERKKMLEEGQQEADRIVQQSRIQAQGMTSESEILQQAEIKSREILERRGEEARALKRDAEAYAEAMLAKLEAVLDKALSTVKAGKSQLRSSLQSSPPGPTSKPGGA